MNTKKSVAIPQKVQVLSRDALKIIACIAMLCDHIGEVFVFPLYGENSFLYVLLRSVIGRIAFPIFCTLFIQGMMYTKKMTKHLLLLGIFAVISEPCFDFAFKHVWLEFSYQNVMLSWFFGLLTIMCMRKIHMMYEAGELDKTLYLGANLLVIGVLSIVAVFCIVDYSFIVVPLCGLVFWMWNAHPDWQFWIPGSFVALFVAFSYGTPGALLAIPFMLFYDGTKIQKRNAIRRYGFYVFYPLHLLILGLIYQAVMV